MDLLIKIAIIDKEITKYQLRTITGYTVIALCHK